MKNVANLNNQDNIKVGGALIDSAWSTGFNNFEWDKKKFPHPEDIIKKLHAKDIRVILVSIDLWSGLRQWSTTILISSSKQPRTNIYSVMVSLWNGGMGMGHS